MYSLFCTALVWLSAVIGIAIMRQIQPESKAYQVWAVFVAVCFTVFVLWYEFLG